jgi:hypothetical protein
MAYSDKEEGRHRPSTDPVKAEKGFKLPASDKTEQIML